MSQLSAIPSASAHRLESSSRLISVPWGPDGSLVLQFPAADTIGAETEVVWPDLSAPLSNYTLAVERAMSSPVGCARLQDLVTGKSSVAIVVDDPSRWTPVAEALPVVLRTLHAAGIGRDNVTISVGVGRHHAVGASAMRRRVGESIAGQYRCLSPPVDDISAYVDLGETPGGIPVRVFEPVARADLRILIGSVLPHLQAGFGGGYKLVFPGTSHRSTLGALHRQGLESGSNAGALMGTDAADNPMRQAIHAAANLIGPCWSISHLMGAAGQVFRILAGHPAQVQDLLAAEVKRRFQAPTAPVADLVVAGNYPWPGDPMQSFKVLLHHRSACRPGGVLVGLFWTDPAEIDRSFPLKALRRIAATGALGGWAIRQVLPAGQKLTAATGSPAAFMLRWARELVVDRTVLVYAPALHERIGDRLGPIRLFAEQPALWRCACQALDRTGRPAIERTLRVFPQGGLTFVSG